MLHASLENAKDVFSENGDHLCGSDALQVFCRFLAERKGFTPYRHAIDQLYALLPLEKNASADDAAKKFMACVSEFNGAEAPPGLYLTFTVGAAQSSREGEAPEGFETMAYRAYSALQHAKSRQLGHYAFDPSLTLAKYSRHDQVTAGYIRHALEKKRLRFAYQPIIDCRENNVAYYECLLRLVQDDYSLTPAGAFIPVAERMGMVDLLDAYVCDMALEELRNYPEVTLAINIATLTIQRNGFVKLLQGVKDTPEIAERLIIEITESGSRDNFKAILEFMRMFQALGCRIALDDFGVGHTSFTQLLTMPVNIIKVDGKFVRNLFKAPENKLLIETVINYSRHFNRKTVAEFVETTELAQELVKMDVDYLQGNYFRPASDNRLWLEEKAETA